MMIITAIIGFIAPFLPELMKFFTRKQDNAHELEVMRLQLQRGAQEHLWRMEEISSTADIKEGELLHTPMNSFGVQLLDAAKGHGLSGWALYPVFYTFALLDFLSGMVRPGITYAAFAFYMVVKWAQFNVYQDGGVGFESALLGIWNDEDRAILVLVLSYWFGQRSAKAAFGGSSLTAYKN